MKYSFDFFGWYSSEDIPSRQTEIEPPVCGTPIVGEPFPNFTGYQWILLPYTQPVLEPIPEPIPERKTILTPLEFINRFTDEEAKAILTLTKTNVDVELWWIKYNKATYINIEDPQTISGVQALEQSGIIGSGRAAEILTKYPV